ncbi:MAG: rod shape-determining protein MreC [Cytophagaceae bacterium]
MHRLFLFLYRYRALLFFLFLEFICGWLIIRNNNYQGAAFFNTSNAVAGNILKTMSDVGAYFNLKEVKEELAAENALLRQELTIAQRKQNVYIEKESDLTRINQFKFVPARVVNNSTARFYNYITIDKGTADGINPGMGVISPQGVVGKVKACSEHFSTVISLLHSKWSVSAKIKGNIDGVVQWNAASPLTADLLYVGRHHNFSVGDTVVTSGYTAVFPEGIMIGRVKQFSIDQGKPFYKIDLSLSTDFTALSYVYVIDNLLREERDQLEKASNYGAEE